MSKIIRPTPQQRAEMSAFIDNTQPGLLDELGISRTHPCLCRDGNGDHCEAHPA